MMKKGSGIAIAVLLVALMAPIVVRTSPAAAAGESTAVVFCDVPIDAFHAPAVAWAHATGIAQGTNPERFRPDAPTTRSQMVTFLHRYVTWREGTSPRAATTHGFVDVPAGTFYDEALRWAIDVDLATGFTPDRFGPEEPLDRAQLAVFIHRLAGAPDHAPDRRFADVPTDAWFATPVTWMADAGLTRGTGPTTFSPGRTATRAEIVTFLWRMAGEPAVPLTPPSFCPTFTSVGDSVMFEAYWAGTINPAVFPGWTGEVAAMVCRNPLHDINNAFCGGVHIPSGLQAVRDRAATGRLGDVVILHLGTNRLFGASDFDRFVRAMPDARQIWFMTVHTPEPFEDDMNAVLRDGVDRWKEHRAIGIIDWHAVAAADQGLLREDDRIHLSERGKVVYGALIWAALSAS